jgi:hypothetical protein
MTTITNTGSFRQNGRDAANAERGALRRWLTLTAAIRETGPSDSDQYAAARSESCEGYVERGGSANSFKTKLSNCNFILDTFVDRTIDQISKDFTSIPDAYRAAKAPVDADGNHVVTVKSADERKGDFRSAVRLALGAGVTTDELRAIIAEEAAKLS